MSRLVLPVLVFLAWAPAAHAWTWPVQGPVLQPFVYDEAHPYASGQHRGIDIGADTTGESVVAPAAGTVEFAGTVPTSGKSVIIATTSGNSRRLGVVAREFQNVDKKNRVAYPSTPIAATGMPCTSEYSLRFTMSQLKFSPTSQ